MDTLTFQSITTATKLNKEQELDRNYLQLNQTSDHTIPFSCYWYKFQALATVAYFLFRPLTQGPLNSRYTTTNNNNNKGTSN